MTTDCPIAGCLCHTDPHWQRPCPGCARLLLVPDHADRLCADCRESLLEGHAKAIEPKYDPAVMHEWRELEAVLWRLYGRLHLGCCERSVV